MMVRTLKQYTWRLRGEQPVSVSFSSTPGFLTSIDDFYLTSRGLAVIETTNGNYNTTLWQQVKPQSLLSWVRAAVANQLATSAQDWAKLFAVQNSGTYNNQWMVLDLERFSPAVPDHTFVVLEQLPGRVEVRDESRTL